jgi:hypothetical protein
MNEEPYIISDEKMRYALQWLMSAMLFADTYSLDACSLGEGRCPARHEQDSTDVHLWEHFLSKQGFEDCILLEIALLPFGKVYATQHVRQRVSCSRATAHLVPTVHDQHPRNCSGSGTSMDGSEADYEPVPLNRISISVWLLLDLYS